MAVLEQRLDALEKRADRKETRITVVERDLGKHQTDTAGHIAEIKATIQTSNRNTALFTTVAIAAINIILAIVLRALFK